MSTEDQRAPRPADSPSNEPPVWLGPVEWATVTGRRRPSGFFVRLEDGGEEAFMELTSVDDRLLCCNEEAAERLAVRLVLPLGLCHLPAFIVLGIVPVVASVGLDLLHG